MPCRRRLLSVVGGVCVLVIVAGASWAADDVTVDTRVAPTDVGRHAERKALVINEVVDRRRGPDPRFIGVGPAGHYDVYTDRDPAVYVREAVEGTLTALNVDVGRGAAGAGTSPAVTVEVWRARTWLERNTDVRIRVRAELGLRFRFTSPASTDMGTVFVLGDAELKKPATPGNWQPVFQAAITDAMAKFSRSRTLARALGAEAAPADRPGASRSGLERIDRSQAYGPTAWIDTLPKVDLGAFERIVFADLVVPAGFKGDPAVTRNVIPDALADRLMAFSPGLFETVERRPAATKDDAHANGTLTVAGDVVRLSPGSAKKRFWIGFGAGDVELHVVLRLMDGAGKVLATIAPSAKSGGFLATPLDDIIDDLATDFAEYLRRQHRAGYAPTEEQVL